VDAELRQERLLPMKINQAMPAPPVSNIEKLGGQAGDP